VIVPQKTGPLGRSARLALLAVVAASLASIVDSSGSARFRNPHILMEPSAWALHLAMLVVFVVLSGTLGSAFLGRRNVRRIQLYALLILASAVVAAAAIGQLAFGQMWGFPLADLVWYFDVLMLLLELIATALAIVAGTPGCELNILRNLMGHRRTSTESARCVIGLDALDRWEARSTERAG